MQFDRYHYDSGREGETPGGRDVVHSCGQESAARILTILKDDTLCPLPARLPEVAAIDFADPKVRYAAGTSPSPYEIAEDER